MGLGDTNGVLDGVRVIELADERVEHLGLLLAGLGADVIIVEPPGGSPTRRIGPFVGDVPDVDGSIHFWHYNRNKRSLVLDLDRPADVQTLRELLAEADVFIEATEKSYLPTRGLGSEDLETLAPHLVVGRMTDFGDDGPWSAFRASDLVHLALGGPMMNCGYDPQPDGTYDQPPIAPQSWHAFIIASEQLAIGVLGALVHQQRTGQGQRVTCAIHEAVAKSTELDLMNWVMRRIPVFRQTCRHASETVSTVPTIAQTKDGRWFVTMRMGTADDQKIVDFLAEHGLQVDLGEDSAAVSTGREIPGSGTATERGARFSEVMQRFVRKFSYEGMPWRDAQRRGIVCAPLRKPHENVSDDHWRARGTFGEIEHVLDGRSHTVTYPIRKWISTETDWVAGTSAPPLDDGSHGSATPIGWRSARTSPRSRPLSVQAPGTMTPFPLRDVRILDFTWFLASAGGTRFMASLGAECIKVEWKANPDTRIAAMAPVGGRAAREAATGRLEGVTDIDMGGQFNNKNPGKRGLSLNVRHPRGLEIARRLVAMSDIVAEGFSPGVMDSWGLGYDVLRELNPAIIYAQQSGMGAAGTYGRLRAVGPIAAALSGVSEMSGLPDPAMPAGWGYSYLDWIGAYSFATAMLTALHHRERTGRGQWIDASQTESGIFITGEAVADWSVNARAAARTGNASPHLPAAPHGVFPTAGTDRWIAIVCFDEDEWSRLAKVVDAVWTSDDRFATLDSRVRNVDALHQLLAEWSSTQEGYALMDELQSAGVASGVCQTAEDRCDRDPQLDHLQWLTEVTGTKIGRWPVAEVPFKLSATSATAAGVIGRGAPCYGEDNAWVLGELLGMGSREISELEDDGVV
jgi:crotonobetainyl-CoA:carnitine CoA-transferase CaiB-like acyl-CoA transferase